MDLKNLGVRLSELRKKSGLNQRQAAEKLGISPAPLSAYELGKKLPPLETLAAIAELYDVSLDFLCGNEKADSAAELPKEATKREDFLRCFSALCRSTLPVKISMGFVQSYKVEDFINSPVPDEMGCEDYGKNEGFAITSISFAEYFDSEERFDNPPWLYTFSDKYKNLLKLCAERDIDADVLDAWLDKQFAAVEGEYTLYAPENDNSSLAEMGLETAKSILAEYGNESKESE
ncbi:MAG: helix-turn-helix transcriptional regulator [Christensenellales bacterium]|nr:helix-turn-helix transcriptional regulator [Christensenellales bacterium]